MKHEIVLTVSGRIPSKKNSKQIIYVRGRPLIISSKDYASWHKTAIKEIAHAKKITEPIQLIHLIFYSHDLRKFDLSNKAESIMDLLVDAGIIEDDNYSIVPKLILEYGGKNKENPRCEIKIVPM